MVSNRWGNVDVKMESAGLSLPRSSISSEKVLFRVQVMKKKREKLTILKEVSLYLFVNRDVIIFVSHMRKTNWRSLLKKYFFLSQDMFLGIGSAHPKTTWHHERKIARCAIQRQRTEHGDEELQRPKTYSWNDTNFSHQP